MTIKSYPNSFMIRQLVNSYSLLEVREEFIDISKLEFPFQTHAINFIAQR